MHNKITTEGLIRILSEGNEVTGKFSEEFPELLLEFVELVVKGHNKFNLFQSEVSPDERLQYTGAFAYLALDAIFTSMHLLMMGYLIPSGNMFRQSIEAISMAALLSERNPLKVIPKKGWAKRNFLQDFINNHKYTESARAVKWLEHNALQLGIKQPGFEIFKKSRSFYHTYSHPSLFSLGARMRGGESPGFIIGGIYDPDKAEFYSKELQGRVSFAAQLPKAVELMYRRAKDA